MLSFRSVNVAKKALSLSITILFTINSLSYAQRPVKDALRETSTALSHSEDMVYSLKHADISSLTVQELRDRIPTYKLLMQKAKTRASGAPFYDQALWQKFEDAEAEYKNAMQALDAAEKDESFTKSSSWSIKNLAKPRLKELKKNRDEAYSAAANTVPYSEEFWDAFWKAEKDLRDAATELSTGKHPVSSTKSSSSGALSNNPVIYMSQIRTDVTLTSAKKRAAFKAADDAPEYDDALWDDYFKAEADYFRAVKKFIAIEERITFSAKSSSSGDTGSTNHNLAELEKEMQRHYIKMSNASKGLMDKPGNKYFRDMYEQAKKDYNNALKSFEAAERFNTADLGITPLLVPALSDITVGVSKVPEIFVHLDVKEQEAMLSKLETGLQDGFLYNRYSTALRLLFLAGVDNEISLRHKNQALSLIKDNIDNGNINSDKYDKIFLSIALALLGNGYKKMLSDSADIIYPILKEYRSDLNQHYSILAVIALAILDRVDPDTLSDYKDNVMSMLEDEIKNGDADNRLMAAVALSAFICIDNGMPSIYKDKVLPILKKGLISDDQYDNFIAIIGLVALTKKEESWYRVAVGYQEPERFSAKSFAVIGKDAYELAEKFNMSPIKGLGISFEALSDKKLSLSLTEDLIIDGTELDGLIPSGEMIANIDRQGMLENALGYTIYNAAQSAKASSAGIQLTIDNLSIDAIKNRDSLDEVIRHLIGEYGLQNKHYVERDKASELLSLLDIDVFSSEYMKNIRVVADSLLGEEGLENDDEVTSINASSVLFNLNNFLTDAQRSKLAEYLKSRCRLDGYDSWIKLRHVLRLLKLGIDISENDVALLISILMGKDGLENVSDSAAVLFAADILSGLDEGILTRHVDLGRLFAILTGKQGLKSGEFILPLKAANALSRFGNRLLSEYVDIEELANILSGKYGLKNEYNWIQQEAACSLLRLDSDINSSYIDEIINIVNSESAIRSNSSQAKVDAAKVLLKVKGSTISPYIKDITDYLSSSDGLKSEHIDIRVGSFIALYLLSKKHMLAIRFKLDYDDYATSQKKTIDIYALDTFELVVKLNEIFSKELGMNFRVIKKSNIEISTRPTGERLVVDISGKKAERDFIYALSQALYINEFFKASSAGLSTDVTRLELTNLLGEGTIKEVITFLNEYGGFNSNNTWRKIETASFLATFDKEVLSQYMDIKDIIFALKDGLEDVDSWVIVEAATGLSRFDRETLSRYAVDIERMRAILMGSEGLRNSDSLIRSIAKEALYRLDKDPRAPYLEDDFNVLIAIEGIDSTNLLERIAAASSLTRFGRDAIAPYTDKIIDILLSPEALGKIGVNQWAKIHAAEAIARLDKDLIAPYMDRIFTLLKDNNGIESSDPWLRAYAVTAFQVIGRKYLPIIQAVIDYPGLEKPLMVLAKDKKELMDMLNAQLPDNLGISCDVTQDGFIRIYINKELFMIFDHNDEEYLSAALSNAISQSLLLSHIAEPVKSSSANIGKFSSAGVSLTAEYKERIEFAAKAASLSDAIGTIVYDDSKLSPQQQQKLQNLIGSGSGSLLSELETKLGGCKVRLMSQGGIVDSANTIIISTEKLSGFQQAKFFIVEQASQDMARDMSYAKIVPLIAIAKGLLGLENINEHHDLYLALIDAIKSLSRGQLNDRQVEAAITVYVSDKLMRIVLPLPTSYDYDNLEQLQRQALMVLIAA